MKRIFPALVVIALVLQAAVPAYCQTPVAKLGRGVANIVTCPFEVPKQIIEKYNAANSMWDGLFIGLPVGIGMTVVRCAVGAFETVTFPFPVPEGYRPVLEPEYTWEPSL